MFIRNPYSTGNIHKQFWNIYFAMQDGVPAAYLNQPLSMCVSLIVFQMAREQYELAVERQEAYSKLLW